MVRTPSHVARAARRARKSVTHWGQRAWIVVALALLVGFGLAGLHFLG